MIIEEEAQENRQEDEDLDHNWDAMGIDPPEDDSNSDGNERNYHFDTVYLNKTRIAAVVPVEYQGIQCCQIITLRGEPYLAKGGEELFDRVLNPDE